MKMKKALLTAGMLAFVTGCCRYDYYDGNVRYTQSGTDCIYTFEQNANRYTSRYNSLEESKSVVYRDTICSQLFEKNMAAPKYDVPAQKVAVAETVTPTVYYVERPVAPKTYSVKRSYVIVPTTY
jgi:hypothetical protein